MSGAVGGIAGAAYRRFAEIARMAAESALIDAPVYRAVKRQAAVFQFVYRVHRLLRQNKGRVLVRQIIAALDRIEGVPLRFIFFYIAQRRADAPLRRAGMAA